MSEKAAKPKIEDVINSVLSGNTQQNALNFVAYLRENKMSPVWSAANAWKVTYKTFTVCFIRLHGTAYYHNLEPGSWHVLPFIGEYDGNLLPDGQKKIVWANKKKCQKCGQCALPLATIFGEKFVTACEGSVLFINPDAAAVDCAKKLIELRRSAIQEGKAKKHVYVAVKKR